MRPFTGGVQRGGLSRAGFPSWKVGGTNARQGRQMGPQSDGMEAAGRGWERV